MYRLFKKSFRDITKDKNRLIVSMLAIIIGMTIFGTSTFCYYNTNREIRNLYNNIHPSSFSIKSDNIDNEFLNLTNLSPDIEDYELKAYYQCRVKIASGEYKTLNLIGIENFDNVKYNQLKLIEGKKAPGFKEALIERDAVNIAGLKQNNSLLIELPDKSTANIKISGVTNDISVHPASIHKCVYLYVSFETLRQLGLKPNKLDIIITGDKFDKDQIVTKSNNYIKYMDQNGHKITALEIPTTPGVNFCLPEYEGSLFLLLMFSIISFLFGCMIMSSLVISILNSQIRQIGILKSIGAKESKIFFSYMLSQFFLIITSTIIALPIITFVSEKLLRKLLRIGNMTPINTSAPILLYVLFISISVILPMVIASFPIRRGLRIKVREALNDYGITGSVKVPKFRGKTFLSRPVLLSIRNSLLKKSRFLLNLITMSLGGAMFVTIVSAMISIMSSVTANLDCLESDYSVTAFNIMDTGKIDKSMSANPDIVSYEIWGSTNAEIVTNKDQLGNIYPVIAPVKDSTLFKPEIIKGRWLNENHTDEIVLTHKFVDQLPMYGIGDKISLLLSGQKSTFTIVGILKYMGESPVFISKKAYDTLVPETSRMSHIEMKTTAVNSQNKDEAESLYHKIDNTLADNGIVALHTETKEDKKEILLNHFIPTLQTFLIVISMLVIISGFGLASTMNIQAAERTKEIGIMKSMGAKKQQIIKIITAESIFIGLISFAVSIILALPFSYIGLNILSNIIINTVCTLKITTLLQSLGIWFAVSLTIGYFASRKASQRATRMTIKESLITE